MLGAKCAPHQCGRTNMEEHYGNTNSHYAKFNGSARIVLWGPFRRRVVIPGNCVRIDIMNRLVSLCRYCITIECYVFTCVCTKCTCALADTLTYANILILNGRVRDKYTHTFRTRAVTTCAQFKIRLTQRNARSQTILMAKSYIYGPA